MKEALTKLPLYSPLLLCAFAAAIILIYGWLTRPIEILWVFVSLAIAFISIGLGILSILIAVNSNNQVEELSKKLEEFQKLQQEIKEEQQKQSDAQSPMVVSMSALSQFLTNWTKQKNQEAKDEKS